MTQEDIKRAEAFKLDDKLVAAEHLNIPGRWKVVGNNTGYIYKDELTQEQAIAYGAELNKNKEESKRYEEA